MIVGIDARIPIFTGRGWGRYTCEIIQALAATEELELRIFLPTGRLANELAERVRSCQNVQVAFTQFEPSDPDHYWESSGGINLEAMLGKVDLLHSPTRFILPTDSRPLVATVHDIAPLSEPPFKLHYREATLRALAYIRKHHVRLIAVSEFTRQELRTRSNIDVEDVAVVHHGIADVFFATQQADRARDLYLLYVGGAGPNKNLGRLITAVRLLRKRYQLHLVMVGDPSWDQEELRKALGETTPEWVRLTGYITDQELAMLYRDAAACVFPSLYEGFGLPLIEAMACGTPLACSRLPVLEEVACDAAAYFDPFSAEDISRAVRSLLEDVSLCSELASRGRIRAREFTWARAARKTIDVYRRALGCEGL